VKTVIHWRFMRISVLSTLAFACRSAPKTGCAQSRQPRAPSNFVARLPNYPYLLDSLGTGSVVGSIADSVFGAGIPGARISANNAEAGSTSHFAYADSAGGFLLRDVHPGNHILTAARIGYMPIRVKITIEAGKVDTVRFLAVPATNLELCTTIITT
jgi:hypothetical protein